MNRILTNKYFKSLVIIAVMLMMNMVVNAFGAEDWTTFTGFAKGVGIEAQGGLVTLFGTILLGYCVYKIFTTGFTLQSIFLVALCFIFAYLIFQGFLAKVKIA